MLDINREGHFHKSRGEKLLREAQKLMRMGDIAEREQAFLKKYKDVVFDEFCYSALFEKDSNGYKNYAEKFPKFIPLVETDDGKFISGEPVIPFTPKTLEHCILRMTNGQKIEDGEYPEDFVKKCRKIQEYSCFQSDDWDKVIEFGKDIVRKSYQAYCLAGEREIE